MDSNSINLRVLTPSGLVLEERASSVTIPSSNGEIGVLPQHARYNGLLGTGILEFQPSAGGGAKRLVISQGFCNFNGDTLSILADYVALADQIDRSTYASERAVLEKTVAEGNAMEAEHTVAQEKLQRIEAIDRLLGVH